MTPKLSSARPAKRLRTWLTRSLLGLLVGAGLIALVFQPPSWQGPSSGHFDGEIFFNPNVQDREHQFGDFLRWQLGSEAAEWPAPWKEDARDPAREAVGEAPQNTELPHATFVNHSTFILNLQGQVWITDPIWSERASPVGFAGPARVRAPGVPKRSLTRVDGVVISHDHYDHLDLPSCHWLQEQFQPEFLVGLGLAHYLRSEGLERVVECDWWQAHERDGLTITMAPARHWSGRYMWGRNRTLWGSWMFATEEASVFFGGDSGYGPHFENIRERLGVPDLGLLPIGAYEPRWFMKDSHMNPDEAVLAHLDLGTSRSLGMHYGTFQLTDEAIDAPVIALEEALKMRNLAPSVFVPAPFGQRVFVKR